MGFNSAFKELKCKNVEYNKLRFSILLKKERVKDDIFNHFSATQNEGRLLKFDASQTSLNFLGTFMSDRYSFYIVVLILKCEKLVVGQLVK